VLLLCEPRVTYAHELASSGHYDVRVWNTSEGCTRSECSARMRQCGIHELPTIVVDGELLACCR
jgi:hypothetical protein